MNWKIQNSLEWPTIRAEIRNRLALIDYNHDMYKLLSNVDRLVTELSKSEVTARQRKSDTALSTHLVSINETIATIEKMLIYFALVN
jgi:hypothetical protein